MGFHPQPNQWTCGPFALKHALLALGRMEDGAELARLAGTHWWSGTDEIRLAKAARACDCDLPLVRKRSKEIARKELLGYLRRGIPVLLCVDGWEHWIAVLSHEKGTFVIIDSLLEPVLNVVSWNKLLKRWRYFDTDYDREEPPELYEMYPLVPRFRVAIRANFSIARIRFLRRPENRELAADWDVYLEDLLDICRPKSPRQRARVSMAEFLRRNQHLILGRVLHWHGDVAREDLVKLLNNFRFVAETCGLVIPAPIARQAVADLAILTTMWAVARRGIGAMYGAGPR